MIWYSFIHFGHFYSTPSSPLLLKHLDLYSASTAVGEQRRFLFD